MSLEVDWYVLAGCAALSVLGAACGGRSSLEASGSSGAAGGAPPIGGGGPGAFGGVGGIGGNGGGHGGSGGIGGEGGGGGEGGQACDSVGFPGQVPLCALPVPASCPATTPWVVRAGSALSFEKGRAVATPSDCSVVALSDASDAILLQTFDSAGTSTRAKSFQATFNEQLARDVAVDSAGNVFMAAIARDAIDLGGGPLSVGVDEYYLNWVLGSFSPSGAHRWSRMFGWEGAQETHRVVIEPDGDIIVSGQMFGTASLGGPTELSSAGSWDAVIVKYDNLGNFQWNRIWGDYDIQSEPVIALRADGRMWWGGWFRSALPLERETLTVAAGETEDSYLVRLSATGHDELAYQLSGPGEQRLLEVATTCDDGAVIVGTYTGRLRIDDLCVEITGPRDAFVVRLDAEGAVLWARSIGGPSASTRAESVAVAPNGSIVVLGRFSGSLEVDGQSYASAGDTDIFLAELAPDGSLSGLRTYGAAGEERAHDVSIMPDGSIVFSGSFEQTLTIDGNLSVTSAGGWDAFVARVLPTP